MVMFCSLMAAVIAVSLLVSGIALIVFACSAVQYRTKLIARYAQHKILDYIVATSALNSVSIGLKFFAGLGALMSSVYSLFPLKHRRWNVYFWFFIAETGISFVLSGAHVFLGTYRLDDYFPLNDLARFETSHDLFKLKRHLQYWGSCCGGLDELAFLPHLNGTFSELILLSEHKDDQDEVIAELARQPFLRATVTHPQFGVHEVSCCDRTSHQTLATAAHLLFPQMPENPGFLGKDFIRLTRSELLTFYILHVPTYKQVESCYGTGRAVHCLPHASDCGSTLSRLFMEREAPAMAFSSSVMFGTALAILNMFWIYQLSDKFKSKMTQTNLEYEDDVSEGSEAPEIYLNLKASVWRFSTPREHFKGDVMTLVRPYMLPPIETRVVVVPSFRFFAMMYKREATQKMLDSLLTKKHSKERVVRARRRFTFL
ncbi:unnamed protein product [Notodromas monacha]|uniref:Uncharacterized protein n=1 Tax=Notodromas monacha TaxID=399045 RepID=A0A7R9GA39_9CRUS|nr:unnamed protein product [Notodromas monacha]CAG0914934.1 unnamed protein product [Notodromas monacha]